MSKTGPISKVEAFYIDNHYKTLTAQELADILDRKVTTVSAYIKKNFQTTTATIRSGDHFAKNKGSVVMTEAASMLVDSMRTPKKNNKDCVTKIRHD